MTHDQTPSTTTSRGFTLIEILVVIAIIAVLAGILLAALSGVQQAAKKTQSSSLMQSFARACDEFALDHGRYPGLLPDAAINGTDITSTQNALLELMGGARAVNTQSPTSVVNEYDAFSSSATITFAFTDPSTGLGWEFAFDASRFGEGPWIEGRVHEPYFSPKSSDLKYTPLGDVSDPEDFELPSIVDAWETPIIYLRAGRKNGPIINNPAQSGGPFYELPQYDLPGMGQFFENALNTNGSLLSPEKQSDQERLAWLTLLLAHPTFWEIDASNAGSEFSLGAAWGTARGRYVLISAGPDTVYLEVANEQVHTDQEINPGDPFTSVIAPESGDVTPKMMESFDDVVVYGGA